jgi:hypothetical protein
MWAMGGGEAALLVLAVAAIGWLRRSIVIQLARPITLGPFVIRFRSEQRLAGRSRIKACCCRANTGQQPEPASEEGARVRRSRKARERE